MRGARMPADVRERFLNETIESGFHWCWNWMFHAPGDVYGEPRAHQRAGGEEPDRRGQSEFVEDPRPQFMRERPQLLFDGVQIMLDLDEMFADRRRRDR